MKKPSRCREGFLYVRPALLAAILSLFAEMVAVLEAVAFLASQPVHRAAESDGGTCLVLLEEAASAGAEPVGAVVPAATLVNPGLVIDEGGLPITVLCI